MKGKVAAAFNLRLREKRTRKSYATAGQSVGGLVRGAWSMDQQHFDQLVKGVRDMKRHMAGKAVRGAVVTNVGAPDGPLNAEVKPFARPH